MDYFYLVMAVLTCSAPSVLAGYYNKTNANKLGASNLYSLLRMAGALFCWLVIFLIEPSFEISVLPYSILFGVFYAVSLIGYVNAIRLGSVVLTALMMQLSLIFVPIWGFLFWSQSFDILSIIGIILCVVSMSLCLVDGKKDSNVKVSAKWLIFAMMGLIGCAGCAIVQRTQQMKFNGEHANMLMIFGMAISLIFCWIIYVRKDRADVPKILRSYSVGIPIIDGVLNFLHNLFVIFLAISIISPTVIYPTIAVGTLALSSIFSVVFFKEKLRWWQWFGMILGAIAVTLLSI